MTAQEARQAMKRAFDLWRDALKAADVLKEAYIDAHNAYLAILNQKEGEK